MMKVRHVIFDLDHTLVDPSNGIINCVTFALQKIGHEVPSLSALKSIVGLSSRDTFEKLTEKTDLTLFTSYNHYFLEK